MANTQEVKATGMQGGSQMRITPDEIKTIQHTFKGNDALLLVLRKIFLPEIDPTAPIGQVIDLWLPLSRSEGKSMEEQLLDLKARNLLIQHVDQMLMQLTLIANTAEVSPADAIKKAKQDSAK